MAEIKEVKDEKEKDDDYLLTLAAGNKQIIAPHLEYEYADVSIHEDMYKLIQYSCEEICSTKEQLNKVMKVYSTFLEPILGMPTQASRPEAIEDAKENSSPSSQGNSDGSPTEDTLQLDKNRRNADSADKLCGSNDRVVPMDQTLNQNTPVANGTEIGQDRTTVEVVSGWDF